MRARVAAITASRVRVSRTGAADIAQSLPRRSGNPHHLVPVLVLKFVARATNLNTRSVWRSPGRLAGEEFADVVAGRGAGHEEALAHVAGEATQLGELRLGFDALRDGLQ